MTTIRGAFLVVAITLASVAATAAAGDWPRQLAQRWEDLSDEQKSRAMENYQRYKSLPPEKQRDVEERYRRWKDLPAADKDRYRKKFKGGH